MRSYSEINVFDIKEYEVNAKNKDTLIWLVKYIIISTSTISYIKESIFTFNNYRFMNVKIDGYILNLRQLRREKKLEQWQASFIKNGQKVIDIFAQWEQ